jgi:hypothetical protein
VKEVGLYLVNISLTTTITRLNFSGIHACHTVTDLYGVLQTYILRMGKKNISDDLCVILKTTRRAPTHTHKNLINQIPLQNLFDIDRQLAS